VKPRSLLAAAAALGALALVTLSGAGPARRVPDLVFVSRGAIADAIPGLGPAGRTAAPGGRLMLRTAAGGVRPLLIAGTLFDVSDPAVSPDGGRIAFAGLERPGAPWRIYVVGRDGTGFRPVTRPAPGEDDFDPCWIGADVLVFASTRDARRAPYADVPVSNLWLTRVSWSMPVRITWEGNGAEEPAFDPASGRIVYARWWYNRFLAAAHDPSGITTDTARALPRGPVNLWQAIEISTDGVLRLAAGAIPSRRGTMAYQPARLADGSWVGVYADPPGLWPGPRATGVQRFAPRYGGARTLAGAVVSERPSDGYGDAGGLAPPSACAPAGLPDGRVVFAWDPGARGDFGLYVTDRRGDAIAPLVDFEGTLELDPAPLVARDAPPSAGAAWEAIVDGANLPNDAGTFVYDCLDVFASGSAAGATPGAPPRADGDSLRFFAVRPRAGGGDTAIVVRTVPVEPSGRVRAEGLTAFEPMFEQLVDARGRPVAGSLGPAHVAGLNFGREGTTASCRGCHLGHSTLAP